MNGASPDHNAVAGWWKRALDGNETLGLPWLVIAGFLRITTRRGALEKPLAIADALQLVDDWLALDQVTVVRETEDHWAAVVRLLRDAGAGGNLVTDAHIAAMAICHGARLATCDRDFARFGGLRCVSPLDEPPGR